MRNRIYFLPIVALLLVHLTGGCTLMMPDRNFDESTLIDWGLVNTFDSSVAVVPFTAQEAKWGVYAAQRMKEYLLEEKAFKRVIYSEDKNPKTTYVITGSVDHLFYGGTDSPSAISLTVRLTANSDNQARFLRTAKATSGRNAYHMTLMRRLYVPAPYPEEVMNGLLKHIAHDITARSTSSPPVQNP